jgi:hypothetical protein
VSVNFKMKSFIIVLIGLVSSLAVASQTVVVEGTGLTKEKAKEDAYSKASQQYCGVAVLSDKKLKNYEMRDTKISIYSSCRVTNATVLKEGINDNGYTVSMQLTLEQANQSKRLFNQSEIYNQFNEDDLKSTVKSYQSEKKTGDKFLEQIMNDFPYHAFELLEYRKPYITEDDGRRLYVVVPYAVIWNKQFLEAMETTLKQFSVKKKWYQTPNEVPGIPIRFYKKNDWKFVQYNLTDSARYDIIAMKMRSSNEPHVKATIYDINNNILQSTCNKLIDEQNRTMYQIGYPYHAMALNTDMVAKNYVTMQINVKTTINNIIVEIVAKKDCKN